MKKFFVYSISILSVLLCSMDVSYATKRVGIINESDTNSTIPGKTIRLERPNLSIELPRNKSVKSLSIGDIFLTKETGQCHKIKELKKESNGDVLIEDEKLSNCKSFKESKVGVSKIGVSKAKKL